MTVNAGRILRHARRAAGLSQREMAARAGIPQSTVARIEAGTLIPRVDTLDRLLRAVGHTLGVEPRLGNGVDRSQMAELLRLTPAERLRLAVADARAIGQLERGR